MQLPFEYCHNSKYSGINRIAFCFILTLTCLWMLCSFTIGAISDTYSGRNFPATSKISHTSRTRPKAFEGHLAFSQAPGLYETASLTLHLESLIDESLRAKVRFVIPQGMFFIGEGGSFLHKPAFFQDIYLPAKSVTQPFVNFTVVKTGNYILQASVYTSSENHSQMPKITPQHFFTYLSVSHTQSTFSDVEYPKLPRFRYRVTHVIPATQRLAPRRANLGIVTVKGTAKYFDDNELRELPIRNFQVTLFDRNRKLPDEKIATTYTNEQGEYDFTVQNIDREDNSKRDLYVIFSFENDTLFIQDRNDRIYKEASETIFDFPDGELQFHLFFDLQDSLRGLGALHNAIMRAHDFLLKKVGWERDAILIQWPAPDSFSYYEVSSIGFKIFEVINIIRGDAWNHRAMYHEYGHAVMTSAYGNDLNKIPFGEYNKTHWLFTVSNREFALSEGWAEFMEAAIEDNALNVTGYVNVDTPNIESNKWWTGDIVGNGNNTRGEIVEGAVASVFWDITDTALSLDKTPGVDDDGISDMFIELWEIFTHDHPIDIIEVAKSWKQRNFDNYDELELIYVTHSILLRPNSPPDITITAPPTEGAVANSSYTIAWIANDKDNEDFTVDLCFDTDKIAGGEIPIKTMISQDVISLEWDTSGIPDGRYYISIIARDIRAGENSVYSAGPLIVDHSPLSPPVVTSSTHPEQSRWYANDSPQFTLKTTPYNLKRQYSYVLNGKPETIPDAKSEADSEENSLSFNNLPEGIWWLHIRAQDDLGYWTDATHFRINIDVSKPPKVENVHWVDGTTTMDDDPSSTIIELSWDAADEDVSGVAQYHIQIYVNSVGVESFKISADNLAFDGTVEGNILSQSFILDVGYTYFARVRAADYAGLLGSWSLISAGFTTLRQYPWDINRDNKVDIEDLVLVEVHFGKEKLSASSKDADVNGDGGVDILDLVLVGKHFSSVISAK